MDTYDFLADEEELKWFWEYGIPPLKREEIYFVSLSCRNKTLTEDERKTFMCGRSEMFAKQQIRHDNWISFLQHIKRFEVRKDAYLTKANLEYPQKSLVVYWNLSPINAYKAMKDQMNYLNEVITSLTDSALKNSQGGIDEAFYKVRKSFDTCQSLFARNFGNKIWVDFDIDSDITNTDYRKIRDLFQTVGDGKISNTMFVRTGGGLHCLFRKEKLHQNPDGICKELLKIIPDAKEIVRNTNEMIPLPGTWQYEDHLVKIVNKSDFTEEDKLHEI
jgi:hypothetical protein